jgi:hypothetical protein
MRAHVMLTWVAVAALAASLLDLTGCGRRGGARQAFDEKAYVGTWMETREPPSARMAVPEVANPNLRRLTISGDRTFKLEICNAEGKPLSPAQTVEGTWTVEERAIVFTVGKSTLKDAQKDWAPTRTSGLMEREGKKLTVLHADENMAFYESQGG